MDPNPETCSAVILTRSHSITTEIELYGQRLSDLLNDDRKSALLLISPRLARLSAPSRIIAEHSTAVLSKYQVLLAFETRPPPPADRRLFGYIKKNQHPVFMMMEGIEVRGVVHTTDSFEILDIYRFLTLRPQLFVPVTHAVVTFCDDERYLLKQPAVMVNAERIQYMGPLDAPAQASRLSAQAFSNH